MTPEDKEQEAIERLMALAGKSAAPRKRNNSTTVYVPMTNKGTVVAPTGYQRQVLPSDLMGRPSSKNTRECPKCKKKRRASHFRRGNQKFDTCKYCRKGERLELPFCAAPGCMNRVHHSRRKFCSNSCAQWKRVLEAAKERPTHCAWCKKPLTQPTTHTIHHCNASCAAKASGYKGWETRRKNGTAFRSGEVARAKKAKLEKLESQMKALVTVDREERIKLNGEGPSV